MRTGISFPSLLSLPLGLPPRPPTHNTRNLAFFFAAFHGAQVAVPQRPLRYRRGWKVEGGRHGEPARKWREQGGRRASCYICNIFAFTIFQLVCILEPLLLASLFTFDSALLFPFSLSLFTVFEPPPMLDAARLPLSGPSPLRRNSFTRAAFPETTWLRPAKDSIFSNNPENAIEGS